MGVEQRPAQGGGGGGSRTGPADTLEALLEEATDAHLRACSAASRVVVGFTLGAEVDAVGRELAGFQRSYDPTADIERAGALLGRAKRVAADARREQRQHRQRTTSAMAGVIVGRGL